MPGDAGEEQAAVCFLLSALPHTSDEASHGLGWPRARRQPPAPWSSDPPRLGGECRIRPPGTAEQRAPLPGLWQGSRGSGRAGTGPCCSPGALSVAQLCRQLRRCLPLMPAASPSPALQILSRAGSWPWAHAGSRLRPRVQPPAAPCSQGAPRLRHRGGRPSPSSCHHERLPAVTNPDESGLRLRCSQSPREIVPRASPQPRGTGTTASLLGPRSPLGLVPLRGGCGGARRGATSPLEVALWLARGCLGCAGCSEGSQVRRGEL